MKMVCQKSRDRQQGPQKQRSLPPKKRTIADSAPPKFSSSQVLPSVISSANTAPSAASKYSMAQSATPVSSDERSISTTSSVSQTSSFVGSMALCNNNNKFLTGAKMHHADLVAATANSKTMKTSDGSAGVMPFISNDSKFVANTLKRREWLEGYRAAKAMLYDAYMKAVNEERR